MKYKCVTVTTNHTDADLVANAFFDAGAGGVNIVDSEDYAELLKSDVIWDYVDESLLSKSQAVKVSTIISLDDVIFLDNLNLRLDGLNEIGVKNGELTLTEINEADWANEWKKYYKPILTRKITVVPTWIKYDAAPRERIMRLDPGMAFGTGEHATTRMCLDMMDAEDKSVIDVGCGSGILGIAAKIVGATEVYMCDIDGQAVEFAKKNAQLNDVEITVEEADLIEGERKADLIFANLTADILMRLSSSIGAHLNPDGEIIASGIINSRLDEVKESFFKAGFRITDSACIDDWHALKLIKK